MTATYQAPTPTQPPLAKLGTTSCTHPTRPAIRGRTPAPSCPHGDWHGWAQLALWVPSECIGSDPPAPSQVGDRGANPPCSSLHQPKGPDPPCQLRHGPSPGRFEPLPVLVEDPKIERWISRPAGVFMNRRAILPTWIRSWVSTPAWGAGARRAGSRSGAGAGLGAEMGLSASDCWSLAVRRS